ncbi:UNVERIFIED_CONTAM: hypothetical protein GTU68_052135 [Idotea baltica]|nr:hypothetical protein [Idotea baltica]
MVMHLIDTHTHVDSPKFDIDRDHELSLSRQLGVDKMIVLAVRQSGWSRLLRLVEQEDNLYAAFGLHPLYLAEHQLEHLTQLRTFCEKLKSYNRFCAIGECGLDYFAPNLDRQKQQYLLEEQLKLAKDLHVPVLLHVRRAHAVMIATLKRFQLPQKGIIHAFSGSREEAQEYLKLGFKLGLGGAATWPQALRLRRVIASLPLDSFVLETDAPDMAPAMYPNQRNNPRHLVDICHVLADILAVAPEELAHHATYNTMQLFSW